MNNKKLLPLALFKCEISLFLVTFIYIYLKVLKIVFIKECLHCLTADYLKYKNNPQKNSLLLEVMHEILTLFCLSWAEEIFK